MVLLLQNALSLRCLGPLCISWKIIQFLKWMFISHWYLDCNNIKYHNKIYGLSKNCGISHLIKKCLFNAIVVKLESDSKTMFIYSMLSETSKSTNILVMFSFQNISFKQTSCIYTQLRNKPQFVNCHVIKR